MRKVIVVVLLPLLLAALAGTALADGKVTIDPNSANIRKPEAAVTASDPKLDQKVSYCAIRKRLHTVAEELSASAGIKISVGNNKADWQVRDIPIDVCAQDIPLGKLLQAIADATHTVFRSETVGGDKDNRTYRIYRTRKATDEITDFQRVTRDAALAKLQWMWDAAEAVSRMPQDKLDALAAKNERLRMILPAVRLTAALSREVRRKVFASDRVVADGKDPKYETILREWYRSSVARMPAAYAASTNSVNPANMMPAELAVDDRFAAEIQMQDDGPYGPDISLVLSTHPSAGQNGFGLSMFSQLSQFGREMEQASGLDIPAVPAEAKPPKDRWDSPGPQFKLSRLSKLSQEIKKLEPPEDEKDLTYADWIPVLAKASGLAIVCEDFISQRKSIKLDKISATGLESALGALNKIQWFVDDDGKTVVGWDRDWRARHLALVPEKTILDMQQKLRAGGIELEDLVALLNFTPVQRRDWTEDSRDLVSELGQPIIDNHLFLGPEPGFWRLYGLLSPDDKALALSDAGLPLAKFDPNWLVQFVVESRRFASSALGFAVGLDSTSQPQRGAVLSDPKRLAAFAVHIVRSPTGQKDKDHPQRAYYSLQLLGEENDEKITLSLSDLECALPLRLQQTAPAVKIDTTLGKGSIPISPGR